MFENFPPPCRHIVPGKMRILAFAHAKLAK